MSDQLSNKLLLNTKEACNYLSINRGLLDNYRKAGLIPCIKAGRNYLYPINSLNQFVSDNTGKEITKSGLIVGEADG